MRLYQPNFEDIIYAGVFLKNLKNLKRFTKINFIKSLLVLSFIVPSLITIGDIYQIFDLQPKVLMFVTFFTLCISIILLFILIKAENQENVYFSKLLKKYDGLKKSENIESFKIIWDENKFYRLKLHENVIRDMYYHPKKYISILEYRYESEPTLFAKINKIYLKD